MLLFSQYARNVKFPLPIYKSKKGWTAYKLQLFKMFPVSSHFCFFDSIAFVYVKGSFKQVFLELGRGGNIRVLMTTKLS